jgi:hypothetical protein
MSALIDTSENEEYRELCESGVILEETQGYIEALVESGKQALAKTEVAEWISIGRSILEATFGNPCPAT